MKLYHYTCAHFAPLIERDGHVVPHAQAQLQGHPRLSWFTDLAEPDAVALGLQSTILQCDRTEFRVAVDTDVAARWHDWAHRRVPFDQYWDLVKGRQPQHWFVTTVPTAIVSVVDRRAVA